MVQQSIVVVFTYYTLIEILVRRRRSGTHSVDSMLMTAETNAVHAGINVYQCQRGSHSLLFFGSSCGW